MVRLELKFSENRKQRRCLRDLSEVSQRRGCMRWTMKNKLQTAVIETEGENTPGRRTLCTEVQK